MRGELSNEKMRLACARSAFTTFSPSRAYPRVPLLSALILFCRRSFLVFPSASGVIFQTFLIDDDFDDHACFLKVDYSVHCNTRAYRMWAYGYACPMIAVFPIGVRA